MTSPYIGVSKYILYVYFILLVLLLYKKKNMYIFNLEKIISLINPTILFIT